MRCRGCRAFVEKPWICDWCGKCVSCCTCDPEQLCLDLLDEEDEYDAPGLELLERCARLARYIGGPDGT